MTSKVLIADDDPEILETLSILLKGDGFSVIKAENGLEAVQLAKKHLPALIMLDIHMPKMDGLTACKTIKSDPMTKNIPVVMLTVEGNIKEIEQAISYGAKTYITKPAGRGDIEKVVKTLIR